MRWFAGAVLRGFPLAGLCPTGAAPRFICLRNKLWGQHCLGARHRHQHRGGHRVRGNRQRVVHRAQRDGAGGLKSEKTMRQHAAVTDATPRVTAEAVSRAEAWAPAQPALAASVVGEVRAHGHRSSCA